MSHKVILVLILSSKCPTILLSSCETAYIVELSSVDLNCLGFRRWLGMFKKPILRLLLGAIVELISPLSAFYLKIFPVFECLLGTNELKSTGSSILTSSFTISCWCKFCVLELTEFSVDVVLGEVLVFEFEYVFTLLYFFFSALVIWYTSCYWMFRYIVYSCNGRSVCFYCWAGSYNWNFWISSCGSSIACFYIIEFFCSKFIEWNCRSDIRWSTIVLFRYDIIVV